MSITRFEHLSNEIFYEIFEYLDICFVYTTFLHLNTRLEHLLEYSSLPMKLNLSWTSKSAFDHYCQQIIASNFHRILSLTISNPLAIKTFLTFFPINSSFDRLEALNLGRMDSEQTISLLTCLQTLPRLCSLSIDTDNRANHMNTIFHLITTLPLLKYCKISSEEDQPIFSIPIIPRNSEEKESTLEHLIIHGLCQLDQLAAILSYTPRLTHLSCEAVQMEEIVAFESAMIINLKNLSLDLTAMPFPILQSFICKVSSRLEVLRISAKHRKMYFDANEWETLISYHLPHLRVFDIQLTSELCDSQSKSLEYDQLIERFQSKFWREHHWFFTYQNCQRNNGICKFFYSIRPYRRKCYQLHEQPAANHSISPEQDSSIELCRHVLIGNQWMNTDHSIRFPYATKLTLTDPGINPRLRLFIHEQTADVT